MAMVTGQECPRQRNGWQGDQRVFDFSICISKRRVGGTAWCSCQGEADMDGMEEREAPD